MPEEFGGIRNWDYRYCWLRDATFTLYALLIGGYHEEAQSWRDWLLRAVAGNPAEIQVLYGLRGERRITELELPWLPGYEGAKPVRIGNAASTQLQLDVLGELMSSFHLARRFHHKPDEDAWHLQQALVEFVCSHWQKPDEGIWEIRGEPRQFTHSKVMAWVALDRAIKGIEQYKLEGPLEKWRALRDKIHQEVCTKGFDAGRNTFVQYYGADHEDAALLLIPLMGFLPHDDPRVQGTVRAIEKNLLRDGFIQRYPTRLEIDGLPPGEGVFLACSFWFVDNLVLQGRRESNT